MIFQALKKQGHVFAITGERVNVNGWYAIGIAFCLAMDAFAAAIAAGLSLRQLHGRQVFRLTFHFGLGKVLPRCPLEKHRSGPFVIEIVHGYVDGQGMCHRLVKRGRRDGYHISANTIGRKGECPQCGESMEGVLLP